VVGKGETTTTDRGYPDDIVPKELAGGRRESDGWVPRVCSRINALEGDGPCEHDVAGRDGAAALCETRLIATTREGSSGSADDRHRDACRN
jgi:hypothetical protein